MTFNNYFAIVWYLFTQAIDAQNNKCFSLQTGVIGKTCVDHIEFTAADVDGKIRCADLCQDSCASVFYSSTTRQCHGCRAMYSSGSGLGTMSNSVYYIKKWHYEYVGCFRDCQNIHPCPRRVMQHYTWSYSMTTEWCADYCKPFGLKYFGTQNSIVCYCDDDTYDIDGPANNCDDTCSGNTSQICGGYSANSVYEIVFEC